MVVRISTMKNIAKAINYNEQKVAIGEAQLLYASGFLKEADCLSFYDKQEHFQRLTSLNEKVQTNVLHVSLNFDPKEALEPDRLEAIATAYMQGIGFSEQPFLLYQHTDAGHPHVHIVSVNIRTNGSRIPLHNLGRNASEKTRKELEERFGLVQAGAIDKVPEAVPVNVTRIQYGKGATKQAIGNVLRHVLFTYNYTSLEQLNAVLKGYQVVADKGEPDSRLNLRRGLQYQVLDESGNRIGVPIKASSFHMRPTLTLLADMYVKNESNRSALKQGTKGRADWILQKKFTDLPALQRAFEKEGISLLARRGKGDVLYGITFIDHKNKLVVNGSELGKSYSAKGISERLTTTPNRLAEPVVHEATHNNLQTPVKSQQPSPESKGVPPAGNLELLIQPEEVQDNVPYPFRKRRKRKPKRWR
jgi:hypothetical protein